MARSFHQNDTSTVATSSTANTSFNNPSVFSSQQTTNTSFNDNSVFSSQQTTNTSFTTDGTGDEPPANWRPRKSSTSLESLGESEAIAVLSACEREVFELEKQQEADRISSQGASRESNSTYGSVNEDLFLHAENGTTRRSGSPLKPTEDVQSHESFQSANVTPAKQSHVDMPHLETPDAAQANLNDSPSRVAWYIRDLPSSNLFVDDLPSELYTCPYFLAFIGCRLSSVNDVAMREVLRHVDLSHAREDPSLFWSNIGEHLRTQPRESNDVWAAAKRSFEGYSFKGKVAFESARSGPVFRLELLPIQPEKSSLFQRMFGSDRFLYLTFPSFQDKPDRFTQAQLPLLETQWKIWINQHHSFLGRKWRVFHVEPVKRKGGPRKPGYVAADTRVILFATEGPGIDQPMSVGEMINGFFNFKQNMDQNFCKAFARLDLGLSRTIPTLSFKPSQIRRMPDTYADRTPEAQEFNDATLDWTEHYDKIPVMNDGCARVSVGAALLIWKFYRDATGSDEPLPSTLQGRIFGAKGMWMISAEPHTRDPAHLDVWIEITDSQLKFEPAREDQADDRPYNSHRLTFNYVKHSFVNGSSDLHISFIPILVDRGVQKSTIARLTISRLDDERKQLLEMLDDPVRLHNWVTKQGSATPALGILPWQAALPLTLPEKAKLLLRTGFQPDQSPFLARTLKRFVQQRQLWMEEKLRAPLGKATYLIGLADPLGVLKPGEVHVQFSKPFLDEYGRNTYRNLAGEEVVIARQPACRRSDMQKMRAVSHTQLSHLVDVVVFSSRGMYPAAGKLQGGDYDGDTFWVCWESDLVVPFLNAPAPLNDLEPQKYGIKKDTRKLTDIMNPHDLSTVDNLLKEALEFRMTQSLLGKATTFAEKVAYKENRIYSERLNALYDVHDLLVDAPKQAYRFDDEDFSRLVRQELRCGNPKIPAYKRAMEASAKSKVTRDEGKDTLKGLKHKPDNIIDYLYFDVVKKHNTETRKALKNALPKEDDDDPDLRVPFLQLKNMDDTVLASEIDRLLTGIGKIIQDWNRSLGDKSELLPDKYNKLMDTCFNKFRALMPSPANASHPQIAPLIFPYLGPKHPTLWETIRASALYTANPRKHSFVWHMAGRELARLKAATNADTYSIVPDVFADLKTKPTKVVRPDDGAEDNEDSEDGFGSAIEQFTG